METANNNLTAERSLEIIAQTIAQSRRDMSKYMGKSLMLWGSLVIVTALIVGHLWQHCGGPIWNLLWLAMTIVGFCLDYVLRRREKTHATGIVATLVGNVWVTFCFFALGTFFALEIAFNLAAPLHGNLPFTGILGILMGMSTAITGFVLKNRLLVFCGIFCGILSLVLDIYVDGGYEMLIIAGMALIGLLVPGIALWLTTKSNTTANV